MQPFTAIRHAAMIGVLSTSSLLAQIISISGVAHNDLSVAATSSPGQLVTQSVPAGTQLPNGFSLSTWGTAPALGQAETNFTIDERASLMAARLQSIAQTLPGSAVQAGSGLSQVLVQVNLAVTMTLDIGLVGRIATCLGQPTGQVKFDIGNDGTTELVVTAQSATIEEVSVNQLITLPAGTTDILVSTELDMPPAPTTGGLVILDCWLSIKPGHATVVSEGGACGAALLVTPLFDHNVKFSIWGEQVGDIPFLALGAARQQLPLPMPISMGCDLLITPDVLIQMQSFNPELVPLFCFGTGQIFAQAAVLQAQPSASAQGYFRMSQRVAIQVH